jgi:MraZ protein
MPKKLREQMIAKEVVLSRGFEKCIFVYNSSDWALEAQKQIDNSITDPKIRELKRYMFAQAFDTKLDSQGRVIMPQNLLKYAGIEKDVVVIGAGDHVEIWDENTWNEYYEKISANLAG